MVNLTIAQLVGEFGDREGSLVVAMDRAIAADTLMPLLRRGVRRLYAYGDRLFRFSR